MTYRRYFTVPSKDFATPEEAFRAAFEIVQTQLSEKEQPECIYHQDFTLFDGSFEFATPTDAPESHTVFNAFTNVVIPVVAGYKVWFVISDQD